MTTNKCIECGSGDAVRGLCEDCREIRQKIQRLKKALSEYLNLLVEDRRLFSLTLSGDDEPQPTKYMGDWIANTIKLKKSEKKLIKIFREYKAKGEKK